MNLGIILNNNMKFNTLLFETCGDKTKKCTYVHGLDSNQLWLAKLYTNGNKNHLIWKLIFFFGGGVLLHLKQQVAFGNDYTIRRKTALFFKCVDKVSDNIPLVQ